MTNEFYTTGDDGSVEVHEIEYWSTLESLDFPLNVGFVVDFYTQKTADGIFKVYIRVVDKNNWIFPQICASTQYIFQTGFGDYFGMKLAREYAHTWFAEVLTDEQTTITHRSLPLLK